VEQRVHASRRRGGLAGSRECIRAYEERGNVGRVAAVACACDNLIDDNHMIHVERVKKARRLSISNWIRVE